MLDAASAHFEAIAIEEGDGEILFLQPVLIRDIAEGGQGEAQHQHGAAKAKGQTLAGEFHQEAPAPRHMKPIHVSGEIAIDAPGRLAAFVEGGIDPGVERQHAPREGAIDGGDA